MSGKNSKFEGFETSVASVLVVRKMISILKCSTVELGNKELFGHPKIVPYEVNGELVTGNGFLIPIWSLSNRSLLPSLTVHSLIQLHSSTLMLHKICSEISYISSMK